MVVEIAPRREERVFCRAKGDHVVHVVLTLRDGQYRWCQTCYVVFEEQDWKERCPMAKQEETTTAPSVERKRQA